MTNASSVLTLAGDDLQLDDQGALAFASGSDAIAQASRQYVRARLGEMLLDRDRGIPYEQLIWVGAPNLVQIDAALRTTLLQVPGVLSVDSLTLSLVDGVLSYNATLNQSIEVSS